MNVVAEDGFGSALAALVEIGIESPQGWRNALGYKGNGYAHSKA